MASSSAPRASSRRPRALSRLPVLPQGGIGDGEGAQAVAHRRVADAEAPGVGLDLLGDARAVAQQAVEVLVALDDQGFVVVQVEPAQDAETGLVEIAADRGVGRALGADEGRRGHRGIVALVVTLSSRSLRGKPQHQESAGSSAERGIR